MVSESEDSVPSLVKKRPLRSRRQVYLQIGAATAILVCGIIIGSGAALLHFKENIVPDRFPPPGRIAVDIQDRYGLTEDQTEKVETAIAASSERMHTIFVGMKEKMDAEFKELSSAMKGILTKDQFQRWEHDFKSRRPGGPGRFGGRPGPGGPGSGGRPGGFGGGPGGGRSGRGRPSPDGRSGQDRPDYRELGPRLRRPAEPNSLETRGPAEPNSHVE